MTAFGDSQQLYESSIRTTARLCVVRRLCLAMLLIGVTCARNRPQTPIASRTEGRTPAAPEFDGVYFAPALPGKTSPRILVVTPLRDRRHRVLLDEVVFVAQTDTEQRTLTPVIPDTKSEGRAPDDPVPHLPAALVRELDGAISIDKARFERDAGWSSYYRALVRLPPLLEPRGVLEDAFVLLSRLRDESYRTAEARRETYSDLRKLLESLGGDQEIPAVERKQFQRRAQQLAINGDPSKQPWPQNEDRSVLASIVRVLPSVGDTAPASFEVRDGLFLSSRQRGKCGEWLVLLPSTEQMVKNAGDVGPRPGSSKDALGIHWHTLFRPTPKLGCGQSPSEQPVALHDFEGALATNLRPNATAMAIVGMYMDIAIHPDGVDPDATRRFLELAASQKVSSAPDGVPTPPAP